MKTYVNLDDNHPEALNFGEPGEKFRHPELDASAFTRIIVGWITPLINLAFKRPLHEDDIYPSPDSFEVSHNAKMMSDAWTEECRKPNPPSLVRVMYRVYKREVWTGGFFQLLFTFMQLLQPLIIGKLIEYVSSERKDTFYVGLLWALSLGMVAFLSSTFLVYSFYTNRRLGLYVRAGIMMIIYEHAMKLTTSSRMLNDIGTTTNLMSIDAEKLSITAQFLHFLWQGPVTVFFVMIILGVQLGTVVAFTTAFSVLVYFPLQRRVAVSIGGKRRAMMRETDQRVSLTSEALKAIRAIKVYAWESSVRGKVADVRSREIECLWSYLDTNNVLRNMNTIHLPLTALLVFVIYVFVMSGSDESSSHSSTRNDEQNNNLTIDQVLFILAYLNIIRFPLNLLAQSMKFVADGKVSVQRLTDFMLLPCVATALQERLLDGDVPQVSLRSACFAWGLSELGDENSDVHNPVGKISEEAEDAAFLSTFRLHNVTLSLRPGELVAVIGAVGAGKSSLISALLGEMSLVQGECVVRGRVALSAQSPWIQHMTLQANILFGQQLGDVGELYERSVEQAALLPDFAVLPHGDATEIGEKGINLSGGQKARVAFCRVLLAAPHSDIILLDDPFSAVDGHTGNWMFHKGILEGLKGKTRVVVLNSHLHLLSKFDRVIIMDGGKVVAFASPTDMLSEHSDIYLQAVGSGHSSNESRVDGELQRPPFLCADALSAGSVSVSPVDSYDPADLGDFSASSVKTLSAYGEKRRARTASGTVSDITELERRNSMEEGGGELDDNDSIGEEAHKMKSEQVVGGKEPTEGQLVTVEKATEGAVSLRTMIAYFGAVFWKRGDVSLSPWKGSAVAALIFLAFAFTQFARVVVDLELMNWASRDGGSKNSPFFVAYVVCVGIYTVCVLLSAKILIWFSVRSAYQIHEMMFRRVLSAPINLFFDVQTVGSMLNRFAKDMETVDVNIPEYTFMMLIQLFVILSVLILCVWSVPLFLLIAAPLCIALVWTGRKFICVSRDLKRLEAISRSPIYSSFSETLSGLETIRAFGATARFLTDHCRKMNRNQKLYFHLWMCQTWLTSRMEYGGCCVLITISVMAVVIHHYNATSVSASRVGLAVVYTLQLTAMLQRNVQLIIDLINYFTSMERVLEYADIPQEQSVFPLHTTCGYAAAEGQKGDESALTTKHRVVTGEDRNQSVEMIDRIQTATAYHLRQTEGWPMDGRVEFRDVYLRYRPNTPLVLKGVSFSVKSGERIGICGRTGAGKSSIMQALFRIVEADRGDIHIAGVNIKHIPLRFLRARLAIIPQDPVIFGGSVRYQLDPFEEYPDDAIWAVLGKVNMAAAVRDMSRGLSEPIAENGENLSQGQKQLLCIARALLRRAKILVMDEATSAVDPNTDDLIQTVLREEAQREGTTILTIAHRLHTIVDFDRILVLGEGEVIEYDTPTYLSDSDSEFSRMLSDYNSQHNHHPST